MKVNVEELIKKRFKTKWAYDGDSPLGHWRSITDEMVDEAVSKSEDEFAIILSPSLLKKVDSGCKFPGLKEYFVTGIFDLENPSLCYEETRPFNNGVWVDDRIRKINSHDASLITYSKTKPKKIKTCACPLEKEKGKRWQESIKIRKSYYKDLETYINTSKVPVSLKLYVNEISYADYREEVFDVRYYSKRFLRFYNSMSRAKKDGECIFVPLKEMVEIINPFNQKINDFSKWAKHIDYKLQKSSYPLNEENLEPWKGFFPLKKDDIVISREGAVYLVKEDSKIVVTTSSHAILRLKSVMVTPEYLFLYLNSGNGWNDINYLSEVKLSQEINLFTNWADLEDLPIFIRKSDIPMMLDKNISQQYRDKFDQHYRPYLITEKEICDEQEKMEDGKLVSDPEANARIVELLSEMNMCLSHRIYNGAIILMGAVLETFLTGWLCDIDGIDYFRESIDYTYEHGKKRLLDLTFQTAIEGVLMNSSKDNEVKKNIRQKVESIRSMRDCVHARVYLKQKNKLTGSVCESALKDLEEIIKLRYPNFQMDSFMKTIAV